MNQVGEASSTYLHPLWSNWMTGKLFALQGLFKLIALIQCQVFPFTTVKDFIATVLESGKGKKNTVDL